MRVTLIHNPGAGDEQPSGDDLIQMVREAGHQAVYQSSKEEGWEGVLEDTGDLVAVAGGDGTVGKVAKLLVNRQAPLTFLPLGTANNISKSFGLADTPLARLVGGWQSARRVKMDVGVASLSSESVYFIEGLGTGLFASTMAKLDAHDNAQLAHADDAEEEIASVLRLLRGRLVDYPARELSVTLDGEDLSGECVLLEAMNIQYVGPNLHLAPGADPGDGLLDVILLHGGERDALGEYLRSRLSGEMRLPKLTTHRGRHLRIGWDGAVIHVDDEVWPDASGEHNLPAVIDVKVERHALELLLPARR